MLLLAFPASMPASAGTTAADLDEIDRFVAERLRANNLPGVALAVTAGDRVLLLKGYGVARSGEPVTARTQFRIGSLSKSFTAAAILQLVEAGEVDLDAPVADYLPEFRVGDPRGGQITVRHLLNHTSGLADQAYSAGAHPPAGAIAERVADLASARLVADPGTSFNYFNLNYAVAARLVEVVAGEPFARYVERHLLEPLGMDDTFAAATSTEAVQEAQRLAQGHVLVYGRPVARAEQEGFLGGYGGMVSTAADLATWLSVQSGLDDAVADGVLSPEALRVMHTPPGDVDSDYGMGWLRGDPGEQFDLAHTGVLSTFYAEQSLTADGYGVVLLFNSYNALVDYHGFSAGVARLLHADQAPRQWLSANTLGLLLAALTVLTLALRVRAMFRLQTWTARHADRAWWRLLPGFAWLLVPTVLLVALPPITTAFAGRAFTYEQLFWSMPSVTIWLLVASITGLVLLITRSALLVWRRP